MALAFSGCSYAYDRRNRVLCDVTVEFPVGATVLLGPNGAGKSTLLSLAAGVLRPTAGEVLLADAVTSTSERKRRVGWMPQRASEIRGLTVREQVALAGWLKGVPERLAWDKAIVALRTVRLEDLAGRRATRLSGGQRARLALAQVLATDAEFLVLDEPTAALDPDQSDLFGEMVRDISRDRVVVVSTHDVSELQRNYDRVVVLDSGQVRFVGTSSEFMGLAGHGGSAVEAYRCAVS
jgi:ABC-2 type transport system ATP-binding protein